MNKVIQAPIRKEEIKNLKAGDYVYINGIIYTARDAAHKRMDDTLTRGEKLPLDITSKRRQNYWISRAYYSQSYG